MHTGGRGPTARQREPGWREPGWREQGWREPG
jgi:hypothetical protein